MQIFLHHIYEYKKGLRHLVLHTLNASLLHEAVQKLSSLQIDYIVQEVTSNKFNVFFGDTDCVDIIRRIAHKRLNEFTPEEDFILGTMLG